MATEPVESAIIPQTLPSLALPPGLRTHTELWSYALWCWQQPGVASACLRLQQQGWSVTRLLCGAWLAHQGQRFDGREGATVTEWRQRVTEALRTIKKALPKQAESCSDLRTGIAKLELEAERIELALAWQSLNTHKEDATMQDCSTLMSPNLAAAAPSPGHATAATTELNSLACILTSARPGAHL